MVLLLSVLICGCSRTVLMEERVPLNALESFARTVQKTDRLIATAQIDLVTAQGHYPVRAALILQRPSYLRLEMLPVIGTPDFYLTASPDQMSIFIPSRGEFYSGKPSAENLARFLPCSFSIEELVMILSSTYPPLAEKQVSYESYQEGNLLRIEMKTPSGPSQTIWIEKNGRVLMLVRNGSDRREIYSVQYGRYAPGSPYAETITIKMADQVTSVSAKYTNIQVEKPTDLSVFELPIPAGVKVIQMD